MTGIFVKPEAMLPAGRRGRVAKRSGQFSRLLKAGIKKSPHTAAGASRRVGSHLRDRDRRPQRAISGVTGPHAVFQGWKCGSAGPSRAGKPVLVG